MNRIALYNRVVKVCDHVIAWQRRANVGDWSGDSLHDIIEQALRHERALEVKRMARRPMTTRGRG